MDELLRRTGIARKDDSFFDQVDLQIEFVKSHPILEIAVKPVSLFHQDKAAGRILLQDRHHLAKAGLSCLLCGLHVDELPDDGEPLHVGVIP